MRTLTTLIALVLTLAAVGCSAKAPEGVAVMEAVRHRFAEPSRRTSGSGANTAPARASRSQQRQQAASVARPQQARTRVSRAAESQALGTTGSSGAVEPAPLGTSGGAPDALPPDASPAPRAPASPDARSDSSVPEDAQDDGAVHPAAIAIGAAVLAGLLALLARRLW